MTINTKYDAGQEVYILNNSNVVKATITRITAEKSSYTTGDALIMYHFSRTDGSAVGSAVEIYRYENEVGSTIAELIRKLAPKEANSFDGVTDDLVKLQKFVRDLATNYDCDEDAHRHNNGACRTCNARKLLVISNK